MDRTYQLTKLAVKGGCAAKLSPDLLKNLLHDLPTQSCSQMLVGFDSSDDAAVYQVNEQQGIIQTMDFFPPMVDDPYVFGQIAATNALSDVYAMGGVPAMAMNLLCVPCSLDIACIRAILKGGSDKVLEAGAVICGGHSIDDKEPKYGLSVMGLVHPDEIWKNNTAIDGDVLVLTKPLGIGIYNLAYRGELLSDEEENIMVFWMTLLNKYAAETAKKYEIHACTDVTGFGLIGHACEMAEGSKASVYLHTKEITFLPKVLDFAEMGIIPMGAYSNRKAMEEKVASSVEEKYMDCLYDPQTAGGLLLAMSPSDAQAYCTELRSIYREVFPDQETDVVKIIGEVKKDSISRCYID